MTDTEQIKTGLTISDILNKHRYIYDGFNCYNYVDEIEYDIDYLKKEVKLIYINLNILNSFISNKRLSVGDFKKYEKYMYYLSYIYLLLENKYNEKDDKSSYLTFINNKYFDLKNYALNDSELDQIVKKERNEEVKREEAEATKKAQKETKKQQKEEEAKKAIEEEAKIKAKELPAPAPVAPAPAPVAPAPADVILPQPIPREPGVEESMPVKSIPVIPGVAPEQIISKLKVFVDNKKIITTDSSCVTEITSIITEINQIETLSDDQQKNINDLFKSFYSSIFCEFLLKFKDFINSKIKDNLTIINDNDIINFKNNNCLNESLIVQMKTIKFNLDIQKNFIIFNALISILKTLKEIINNVNVNVNYNKNNLIKDKINVLFNALLSKIKNCHNFNYDDINDINKAIETLSVNIDTLKQDLDKQDSIISKLSHILNFNTGSIEPINEGIIDGIKSKINLVVDALNGDLFQDITSLTQKTHLRICDAIQDYLNDLYMNILKIYIKLLPTIIKKFNDKHVETTEIFLKDHLGVFNIIIKHCLDRISKKDNNGIFFSSECLKGIKQEYTQSYQNISNVVQQIVNILSIIKTIKKIKISEKLFIDITNTFIVILEDLDLKNNFSIVIDLSSKKSEFEEIIRKLYIIPILDEEPIAKKHIYKYSNLNEKGIVIIYDDIDEPIFCYSDGSNEYYSCFLNCSYFNEKVNNQFDINKFKIDQLEEFLGINEIPPPPPYPKYEEVQFYISDRNKLSKDGVNFFKITKDHKEILMKLKNSNGVFEDIIFTCSLSDCMNKAVPPNYTNPQYTTQNEFFKELLRSNYIDENEKFSYQDLAFLSYNYNKFNIFDYREFNQGSSYPAATITGYPSSYPPYTSYPATTSYPGYPGYPVTTSYPGYPYAQGGQNDDDNKNNENYINKIIVKIFNKLMISSEEDINNFFEQFEKFN
jgi:hypothetical protein